MGKVLSKFKSVLAFVLCGVMLLSLAACGQQEAGNADQNKPQNTANDKEEHVYYPEYIALNSEEDDSLFSNFLLEGNDLYYCKNIYDEALNAPRDVMYKYSLEDGSTEKTMIKAQGNGRITYCTADVHGNIYTLMNDVSLLGSEEEAAASVFLRKYDSHGAFLLELDMAELVDGLNEDTYIWGICADDQKNIYISSSSFILLLNSEGEAHGEIELSENGAHYIFCGKDGTVYLEDTAMDGNVVFSRIDFEGKKLGDSYKNIPGTNNISVAKEKDFLLRDDSTVYEYELESETYEKLFSEHYMWILDYRMP